MISLVGGVVRPSPSTSPKLASTASSWIVLGPGRRDPIDERAHLPAASFGQARRSLSKSHPISLGSCDGCQPDRLGSPLLGLLQGRRPHLVREADDPRVPDSGCGRAQRARAPEHLRRDLVRGVAGRVEFDVRLPLADEDARGSVEERPEVCLVELLFPGGDRLPDGRAPIRDERVGALAAGSPAAAVVPIDRFAHPVLRAAPSMSAAREATRVSATIRQER